MKNGSGVAGMAEAPGVGRAARPTARMTVVEIVLIFLPRVITKVLLCASSS
jgi:hypothetical protein